MILVDTSVWVDHLRAGDGELRDLLLDGRVLAHPFVTGELACGNLANRGEILDLLARLPQAPVADQEEMLFLIERHRLMGRGLGFIDTHLLGAVFLAGDARLWTRDKRLAQAAMELGIGWGSGPILHDPV